MSVGCWLHGLKLTPLKKKTASALRYWLEYLVCANEIVIKFNQSEYLILTCTKELRKGIWSS
jgi:hypothetical protein